MDLHESPYKNMHVDVLLITSGDTDTSQVSGGSLDPMYLGLFYEQ